MNKKAIILIVFAALGVFFIASIVILKRGPVSTVLRAGNPTPPFSVVDEKGSIITSDQLRGRIVFLHFWATWCPPCITEIPSIAKLYARHGQNERIKFLFVLYEDTLKNAEDFFRKTGVSLPLVFDPELRTANAFGLTGVPETYLIGPDGNLLQKFIGPAEWDTKEILTYFDTLMTR